MDEIDEFNNSIKQLQDQLRDSQIKGIKALSESDLVQRIVEKEFDEVYTSLCKQELLTRILN